MTTTIIQPGAVYTTELRSEDNCVLIDLNLTDFRRAGTTDVLRFEYSPPSAQNEWILNHNFGWRPLILVLSPGGVEVEAEVIHTSLNQSRVLFNQPQMGTAIAR